MNEENSTAEMKRQIAFFRDMLPLRLELDAISRFFSGVSLAGADALDIGLRSPVMSHILRGQGGHWRSVVVGQEAQRTFSSALGEPVAMMASDGVFPFEDKQFDWIVVGLGMLSRQDDDVAFIEECHRVLRPAGHLLISVEHAKPLGLATLVARLIGARPLVREGHGAYSDPEVFDALKSGFDVLLMRSYCRFWTQLVRFWEASRLERDTRARSDANSGERTPRFFPNLYRIAYQLDAPLFMTRGHVLLVHARRHPWRARTAPVLTDGRNITEAVLTRATR